MTIKNDLQIQVMMAARDQNINSVFYRNIIGRKLGLNITDYECLSYLTIKSIATPTELARYTGLTTGSMTVMLDRLEKAKLVKRKPNPQDRRGLLIEINQEYLTKVKPFVSGIQKVQTELISNYSEKELKIILDFLTKFAGNVKEQTEEIEKKQR